MFQRAVLRSEATLGRSEATFAAKLIAVHTFFFCASSDARTISPIGLTASENGPIFRLSLVWSCSVITTLVLSFCSCSRFSLLSGVIFPALLKFLCLCRCCGFAALLSATRFFQSCAVQICNLGAGLLLGAGVLRGTAVLGLVVSSLQNAVWPPAATIVGIPGAFVLQIRARLFFVSGSPLSS